jgi:hypothetical protein
MYISVKDRGKRVFMTDTLSRYPRDRDLLHNRQYCVDNDITGDRISSNTGR